MFSGSMAALVGRANKPSLGAEKLRGDSGGNNEKPARFARAFAAFPLSNAPDNTVMLRRLLSVPILYSMNLSAGKNP